jgi:hypothetical protein
MMDSFTVISLELSTLAKNLKAAEEQREQQKKVCYMFTKANIRALKYVRDLSSYINIVAGEVHRFTEKGEKYNSVK